MRKICSLILAFLLISILSACNGEDSPHLTGAVSLPYYMSIDSSDGIIAYPYETEGDTEAIEWSSSNPAIATIDDEGQISVLGAGTVTITATSGAHTATSTLITTWDKYTDYTRIRTKAEFLMTFSNPDNFNDPDKKFVLTGDIDFGGDHIEPIGGWDVSTDEDSIDPTIQWRATLDGRGYALKNFIISNPLKTNVDGGYFGVSLIPFFDGGAVRNLNIIDATFYGTGFTGSIAGKITNGVIENCFVRANITATSGRGGLPAGGIAGIVGPDAVIRNVVLDVNISGGFIYSGFNFGTVTNVSAVSETLNDFDRPNPMRETAITTNKGDEDEDAALNPVEQHIRLENNHLTDIDFYTLTSTVRDSIWVSVDGYMPFVVRADGQTPDWALVEEAND